MAPPKSDGVVLFLGIEGRTMKIKVAVIACLFVLVSAWIYVHAQTASPTVPSVGANGRYEVLAVDFNSAEGESPRKMVIKTDTQTGKAWNLFEYKNTDNTNHLGWAGNSRSEVGYLPFLPHLAFAALAATFRRCSLVMVTRRRFPPI